MRDDLDRHGCHLSPSCTGCFCSILRSEPFAVRDALRAVIARFAGRLSATDAGTLELALAEVLNNVVEHGYRGLEPGLIAIVLRQGDDSLHCSIEDRGHAMPELALPAPPLPPVNVAVADLAEGGWGWALVRELTADLRYMRRGDRNRVSFRIPLTRS